MLIEQLLAGFDGYSERIAVHEGEVEYRYSELKDEITSCVDKLKSMDFASKQVVAIQSDFSFRTIALILALFELRMVVVLISPGAKNVSQLCAESNVEHLFQYRPASDSGEFEDFFDSQSCQVNGGKHPLLVQLEQSSHAGFVVFSSGSTGTPKAVLHDLEKFLTAYKGVNKAFNTLSFLLLDHIAGVDTLLYTLSCGGSLSVPKSRSPVDVCLQVEKSRVEVLPVSPSFLNLLLLSGEYRKVDLSSLKIVTYGSEPVSASLLEALPDMFGDAKIIQKYGTSEFGSPRSKSKEGDSAWIKLDSDRFQTRIDDGILWIKSSSTMLGYLNAEGMLEQDGWLCTGDMVELDGEWMKILGRKSDIINVGGEKVFPAEVESVVSKVDGVIDCLVFGEPHAILGNQVCVKLQISDDADQKALRRAIRKACNDALERYKVPSKFVFGTESLTNNRAKKVRSLNA